MIPRDCQAVINGDHVIRVAGEDQLITKIREYLTDRRYCQPDFSPAAGIVTPANSLSLKLSRTEKNTSGFFGAVHNRDSFFCIYISYLYTYYKL